MQSFRLRGDNRFHSRKERRVIVAAANLVAQRLWRAKRNQVSVANACRSQVRAQPLLAEIGLAAERQLAHIDHMLDTVRAYLPKPWSLIDLRRQVREVAQQYQDSIRQYSPGQIRDQR